MRGLLPVDQLHTRITDEPLSLNGTGFGGRGALVGVPGTSSAWVQSAVANLITLAGATTVGVDAGATVDLSATITGANALIQLQPTPSLTRCVVGQTVASYGQ